MIKRCVCLLVCFIVVNAGFTQAVKNIPLFSKTNLACIRPEDQYKDIIRKAATVTPSPRQLSWQKQEITAFLHFGINTFTNREWGDGSEDPKLFNPGSLVAAQWIRICKKAGIKTVILTAKHHDGFCLWPSRYTDHSVKYSPWKNGKGDVVKDVARACKKYGLGLGIYLSPWDRHSSFFGDTTLYNKYFLNQLSELLTRYGRISEVWFDGANGEGPNGKKQVYDFDRWYRLIRKLQPGAVIAVMGPDVRWVGTESGYGRETEWSVVPIDIQLPGRTAAISQKEPGFSPVNRMDSDLGSRAKIMQAGCLAWYPAEIDVSIRPGWFYHPAEDNRVKSSAQLMDIYINSVGKNGVLLLNIPPNKKGLIPNQDRDTLYKWTKLLKKTFAVNFLKKAAVKGNNIQNEKDITDDLLNTFWMAGAQDTTATLEFRLKKPQLANLLKLQENIELGQRIEKFYVEYKVGSQWKKLVEGTTVGYKRLLRFPSVTIAALRISILSSRLNPTLAEVGLYKEEQ